MTGASGGIVGALALILARAGHRLVLYGLDLAGL
jgi:3-oxoacyl-[acyl-carrier protein] reductase